MAQEEAMAAVEEVTEPQQQAAPEAPSIVQQEAVEKQVEIAQPSQWLSWFKSLRVPTRKDVLKTKTYVYSKWRCLRYGRGCSRKERNRLRALAAAVGIVVAGVVARAGYRWDQKQTDRQSLFTIEEVKQMSVNEWNEALFDASKKGDVPTLRTLIITGKDDARDINTRDESDWTPLIWASKKGHVDTARLLLEKGARADFVDDRYKKRSPLMYASDEGHLAIVELLTNPPYSVPIDVADKYGRTAFMLAAEQGRNDVVKKFLDLGIDINQTDKANGTALILAVIDGRDETVELLLERGADITIKSEGEKGEYGTALEIAEKLESEKGRMEREPYTNIVALLKEAAA